MACGVFAPIFIVLHLFFFFFACFPALLVLFASLVYLCCLCGSLGVFLSFLFPFRTIRKKKGRAVLVRPLLVCCVFLLCVVIYIIYFVVFYI